MRVSVHRLFVVARIVQREPDRSRPAALEGPPARMTAASIQAARADAVPLAL
jgi:hypothetical protein